jgi:hypothetical protein
VHAAGDPVRRELVLERGIAGCVSDEQQLHVEPLAHDVRERAQDWTDPFFRRQLSKGRKDDRPLVDPQARAHRVARGRCDVHR